MESDDETATCYRQRAAELRELAALIKDTTNRQALLAAAESYECMATWPKPELLGKCPD